MGKGKKGGSRKVIKRTRTTKEKNPSLLGDVGDLLKTLDNWADNASKELRFWKKW